MGFILADSFDQVGKISLVLGKVFIKSTKDSSWLDVNYNHPVFKNDLIKTGNKSRAEITIDNSKIIRIGENTIVEITKILDDLQINTKKGRTWYNVILFNNQQFKIKTPTAVAAIRGTVYRVYCDTSSSMFRVYKGIVAVNPSSSKKDSVFLISKGEEFVITNDISAYIKNEKDRISNYMKNQNDLYNEFILKEKNKLNIFKKKEETSFKKFQDTNYRISHFNTEQDSLDDWVRWNQNLDSKIKK